MYWWWTSLERHGKRDTVQQSLKYPEMKFRSNFRSISVSQSRIPFGILAFVLTNDFLHKRMNWRITLWDLSSGSTADNWFYHCEGIEGAQCPILGMYAGTAGRQFHRMNLLSRAQISQYFIQQENATSAPIRKVLQNSLLVASLLSLQSNFWKKEMRHLSGFGNMYMENFL